MHPMPSVSPGERARTWAAPLAIVLLAALIRWHFFVGFGVTGDDFIYAGMSDGLARRGWPAVDLRYGVNYRLGLSVPLALLFRTFGASDLAYVIYPLLASLVGIVLVFVLGRRLFGSTVGLTAAFLVATCPFDAVFASSMTIDVITSCLTAITVLAFLAARESSVARCVAYALIGAAATLVAYMIKEPAVYVLPVLGVLTLTRIRDRGVVLRDVVFGGLVAAGLAATLAADFWATGDALNRVHVQWPQSGAASGPVRETLLLYPRWVWLRTPEGTMPFGYLFYALVPALLYLPVRRPARAHVPLLWLLVLVLLLEFLPKDLHPLTLSPRYARYAHAWIAPASLVVAVALDGVRRWRRGVFWVCLAVLATSGLVEARTLHRVWTDPLSDRNDAASFLAALPVKAVYADFWLLGRYSFAMQYALTLNTPWAINGKPLQTEVIERNDFATLWTIPEGYVVTGGSRGAEVGTSSVLNLKGNVPPPTWRLLEEIARPLGIRRLEPLRVWEVIPMSDGDARPDACFPFSISLRHPSSPSGRYDRSMGT